jgi:hypothetical protein
LTPSPTILQFAVILLGSLFGSLVAGEPPKLDPNRPIQFDVWLETMDVPAAQKAAFDKDRALPKFKLLGGWIEGGKVSAAYAPSMTAIHGAGACPEEKDWDLCPYGPRAAVQENVHLQSQFAAAEMKLAAETVTGRFTWQFVDGRTPEKTLSPACKIQIEAKKAKVGWVGHYTGQYGDYTISGPCVVVARQVAAGLHDPQNGLYQILNGTQTVFLEVRGGKVAQAAALAPTSADILPATVESFSVATQDFGLNGRGAVLGGQVTVKDADGKPTVLSLDKLVLGRAGRLGSTGMFEKSASPVKIRLDSLADPLVARWRENLSQVKRGMMTVPAQVAAQALAEANECEAMPMAGPLTRYLHRLTKLQGHIYAPWCDFLPVEGAVRYRYEVKSRGAAAVAFEADSPQASLSPVWAKVPVGELEVRLVGLDTAGKPIGTAQQRAFRRRTPLAAMPKPVEPSAALELALRLPHYLTEDFHGHAYLSQAVQSAGFKPFKSATTHWRLTPQLLAAATSDPAQREQYFALADTLAIRQIEDDAIGDFKTAYHYWGFSCGAATHTGRNLLNLIGDRSVPPVVERLGLWTRFFGRLQQPSGSWTLNERGKLMCNGNIGMGGNHYPDQNAAPWLSLLARYRQVESDPAQRALARALEDKALAWVRHNSLRTGYWENIWMNSPGNHWNQIQIAVEYPLYDLFHAPAANRDPMMIADLLRWQEDLWINWEYPDLRLRLESNTFGWCIESILALSYLELYALTGDPLALARSEALASHYLARADVVRGHGHIFFGSNGTAGQSEGDDPDFIVRWAQRYRQLKAQPPAAIPERHLSLTLDRLLDGRDRVVLDLAVQDGRIIRALARTPTWDGPGENITQPGRLHWRAGKALFHRVDVSSLKLDANGVSGPVRLWLKEPQAGTVREVGVELQVARRWTSGWQGRWMAGKESGRVSGLTIADLATTGPVQLAVRIPDALVGGEAWQNWVSVSADPATSKAVVLNPNAGWSAETKLPAGKVGAEDISLSLETTVTWQGVAEIEFDKKFGRAAGAYKTAPDDRTALLANWAMNEETRKLCASHFYNPGFKADRPGDMDVAAGYEYKCPYRPVNPGSYRFGLTGHRLGDIVFGTATVTGPDGKARTCQFLGDLTTIAFISPSTK